MNEILEKLKTARNAVRDLETVMPNWERDGVVRDLDEVIALVEGGEVRYALATPTRTLFIKDEDGEFNQPCLVIPLKQPLQPTEHDRRDALHAIAAWVGVGPNEIQVAKVEAAAIVIATLRRDRGEA